MASTQKRPNGQWRARYRGPDGREYAAHFRRQMDANAWLKAESAKMHGGTWVDPRTAKTTMGEWCKTWLDAYDGRPSTVRQARVHVAKIVEHFGNRRLDTIKPIDVEKWTKALKESGLADSTVYAHYRRLAQVFIAAVNNNVIAKSPIPASKSPATGSQRQHVATTAQVWALHDAIEDRYRAGVLVAAFAGLRLAEVCGLRASDVEGGRISPVVQYPDVELKTDTSKTPIPIPSSLVLTLSAHMAAYPSPWLLSDPFGRQVGPWQLQRAFRAARAKVKGLPEGFRFHDMRHYYASLLISQGLDVKVVQSRLRHSSAQTTLDTYAHLWPDRDEATNAAVDSAMRSLADCLRTVAG